MKVEVAVLGSPSLISLTVSVDVKQHSTNTLPKHLKGLQVSHIKIYQTFLSFFFIILNPAVRR